MKKIFTMLFLTIFALWIIWASLLSINNVNAAEKTAKEIKGEFEKSYVISRLTDEWLMNKDFYEYFKDSYSDIYSIYISYDYLNKTKSYNKLISIKKEALKLLKEKQLGELAQLTVDKSYNISLRFNKNLSWYPKDFTDDVNFKYMIEWVKNDTTSVKYAKKISKALWIDYRLVMSAILTEQVRYAMTERGEMKKFLQKTPVLLYLTRFSYWIWWIKSFTAEKVRNDAIAYWYWKDLEKHIYISWETAWKNILINKYYQVAYPAYLIKNIITRWKKAGYNIENNPGVIITLYNFWNIEGKKPHGLPKVGWSDISIKSKSYNFGWLGESFYWWMKIYKII